MVDQRHLDVCDGGVSMTRSFVLLDSAFVWLERS